MKHTTIHLMVTLALNLCVAPLSAETQQGVKGAATIREGAYVGGRYRIKAPVNWNGGLVVYAHGYQHWGEGVGSLRRDPLEDYMTERGYASAASGYRDRAYRPDWYVDDMLALKALFIREFGRPRWTVIHGWSMGGHVAVASLELHPGAYQGALIQCGVVSGVGAADFLHAYTAAAEYVSGVKLLDAPNRETFWRMAHEAWLPTMVSEQWLSTIRLKRWPPLMLPTMATEQWLPPLEQPGAYTQKGQQFASIVKHLMGGDLPFWRHGLRKRYLKNFRLRSDPTLPRHQRMFRAASTLHVKYRIDDGLGLSAETLNKGVRRIAPAKDARSPETDPVFAEFTGRITVPVLTLHNTGDARVPFSLEQDYRRKTIAAGADHLLVQRAIRWPGHCNAHRAEQQEAFDDLMNWIEQGVRPDGDDVLAADLSTIGLRWTRTLHPDDPARQ